MTIFKNIYARFSIFFTLLAVALSASLFLLMGIGHTLSIYSNDTLHILVSALYVFAVLLALSGYGISILMSRRASRETGNRNFTLAILMVNIAGLILWGGLLALSCFFVISGGT